MFRTIPRRIHKNVIADIAVIAALVGLVGFEAASVLSVTDDLSIEPSGLVLDASDDHPLGVAIGEPGGPRFVNERLARRASPPGTVTTL